MMHFLLFFPLLCLFLFVGADQQNENQQRQFNCPNGGNPRLDGRTGRPVQCLPGRSSDVMCGEGYACFFSGFNYQCCPSTADEQNVVEADVPKDDDEEKAEEESANEATEETKSADDEEAKKEQKQLEENNGEQQQEEEKNETGKPSLASECPEGAFTVLKANGDPTECGDRQPSADQACAKSGMFCYAGTSSKFCCERFGESMKEGKESARTEEVEIEKSAKGTKTPKIDGDVEIGKENGVEKEEVDEGKTEQNELEEGKTEMEQKVEGKTEQNELEGNQDRADKNSEELSLPPLPGVVKHVEDPSTTSSSSRPPAIPSTKLTQKTEETEQNELEIRQSPPANNKVEVDEEPTIRKSDKMAAQQYLLEQIKNGWPYEDKFYRPNEEDIIVLRNRGRPSAILHFPN